MREEPLRLRAHHGMCMAFFQGKGYSDGFTEHMGNVVEAMSENPLLQIVVEADVICRKCPNLVKERCNTFELVQEYDKKVIAFCGISENAEISWNEFFSLISERILMSGKRKSICGNCQWNEICEKSERSHN